MIRRALGVSLVFASSLAMAQPAAHGGDADPHASQGRAERQDAPEIFRAPPDTSDDDPALPSGTIVAKIVDARGNPVVGVDVTLGVMEQSVAKGDSRKHLVVKTGADGVATWAAQQAGDAIAYRVSVTKDGAKFSAMPFRLLPVGGVRVLLHVYPATRAVGDASVFFQGAVFVDVKDDRVQIQQAMRVSNFSPVAWVPDGVTFDLPEGFSAFNASQSMSDQGVDAMGHGAKLRGTFGPGESDLGYSWQLPYSGDPDVSFELTMPPRMASLIVRAAASGQVRLVAETQAGSGWTAFPAPEVEHDEQGNRLLVTGLQVRPDDAPLRRVRVTVRDLPTAGSGRWIAVGLSASAIVVGLAIYGRRRDRVKTKGAAKSERAAWLEELEELERAFASGDVGPKTYERARREIIDGLARTLSSAKG